MDKTQTKRSWIAIIFGLVFFLAGLGFLFFLVIPDIHDGWRMQSWHSTQATLISAKLQRNRSDDSDTFKAVAKYQYTVNNISYTNNRVAIAKDSDNIGDFQETIGNKLLHYLQTNRSITIWYNPANPAESIINRTIRWGLLAFKMIFVVVFGGFGFALMYFSLKGKKVNQSKETLLKPWLTRSEWKNSEIKSNAKTGMIALWFITVFWNSISFPITITSIPEILEKEEYVGLLILLFPVIGLGLLYWSIKLTLQWRRFGVTLLTLDPYPGSIDGQVGGSIKVNTKYNSSHIYKVTLSCIYSYESGSGKNRSRKEKVKWQDEGHAKVKPMMNHINVEFCFDVPNDLPISQEHSKNYHLWRLTIESEMEGVDLNRNFEIPVYNTRQTSSHINFKSPEYFPTGIIKTTAEDLLPLISQNYSTKELYYSMLRNPITSFSGLIFGGIFSGVGLFLWNKAISEGFMLYVMSSIFTTIGLIIVISSIYSAFNSLHLILNGINLHYKRKFLWLTLTDKIVPYAHITSISSKESSSTHTGGKHKIQYKIYAEVARKKYTLAENIESSSKKDLVIDYFKKEIFNR